LNPDTRADAALSDDLLATQSKSAVALGAPLSLWNRNFSLFFVARGTARLGDTMLNRIHAYEVAGSPAMMPVSQALAGPVAGWLGIIRS